MIDFKRYVSFFPKKVMAVLLIVFVFFTILSFFIFRSGPLNKTLNIMIPQGMTLNSVAVLLHDVGVIRQNWVFKYFLRIRALSSSVKAGEYEIPAHVSLYGLSNLLTKGRVMSRFFTLPEGLSSHEILERLKGVEGLKGTLPTSLPEGVLLPETYHYTYGETYEVFLNRMMLAQKKMLDYLWKNRNSEIPIKTKREALILASIVEKESAIESERSLIASVFMNRLHRKMRLQSDPTVIYALAEGKNLGRDLMRRDWKFNHPYNTYVIKGLPPGPICHPGWQSLYAVLNPEKSDYFYFVSDKKGAHYFSKTLKEHNQYILNQRQN